MSNEEVIYRVPDGQKEVAADANDFDELERKRMIGEIESQECSDIEIWQAYRSCVEHEDDLMNQRLYRLFVAHASLAAAAGVVTTKLAETEFKTEIPVVLITFGLLSIAFCINQFEAVNSGCKSIRGLVDRWAMVGKNRASTAYLPPLVGGGKDRNEVIGLNTSLLAPGILMLFWIVVLAVGLWIIIQNFSGKHH